MNVRLGMMARAPVPGKCKMVRAPLTGIVLMVELTGKYDFMLPLLGCLVAYGVAEALRDTPINEALRDQAKTEAGRGVAVNSSRAAP